LEEDGSAEAHRTACHFWREIEIAEAALPASQLRSNPNLAKLQEFFRRPGDTLGIAEETPSR
jgi:hypothetical protein